MVDQLDNGKLINLMSQNDIDSVQKFSLNTHFILSIAHVFQFFKSIYQLFLKPKVE